jgi:hypothetical protein
MDPLKQLQSLSVEKRIALVDEDISTGKDRYRTIPAHELALVLGIADSGHPGGDWSFTSYVERVTVEEYVTLHDPPSEVLYALKDRVGKERFAELIAKSDELDSSDSLSFSFLSAEERSIVENAIAKRELEGVQSNGMNCIGHTSVVAPSGHELRFEGDIEDDGACITLRTPYDFRDGGFHDLSKCLTESW